jgi:DNA-binding transcriptional regulator YiaG
MKGAKMNNKPSKLLKEMKKDWLVSLPDELHPNLGPKCLDSFVGALAPDIEAIRQMLIELRMKMKWPRHFAAVVLGVPASTLAKWETGKRNPSGAAKKLIFLLHALVVDESEEIRNCWDLAVWGKVPCRNSLAELKLYATHFAPGPVMCAMAATPDDSAPASLVTTLYRPPDPNGRKQETHVMLLRDSPQQSHGNQVHNE